MAKLFDALEEQIVNGQSAVLLSIYKSTGSAPRGAGAHMLVTEAGRVFGTVGGGAVEYESELFAHRLLKEKKSVCEHYRLAPNDVRDLCLPLPRLRESYKYASYCIPKFFLSPSR